MCKPLTKNMFTASLKIPKLVGRDDFLVALIFLLEEKGGALPDWHFSRGGYFVYCDLHARLSLLASKLVDWFRKMKCCCIRLHVQLSFCCVIFYANSKVAVALKRLGIGCKVYNTLVLKMAKLLKVQEYLEHTMHSKYKNFTGFRV